VEIAVLQEEKEFQITTVQNLWKASGDKGKQMLNDIQKVAVQNGNLFNSLMDVVKFCSLGQITKSLFEVGGQYRRNM
jgi:methylmalonyl-CoA mutase